MNSRSTQHRAFLALQIFWMFLVFLLGGWWGWLLLKQGNRIAELEQLLGQPQSFSIHRMLIWESGTFLALLFVSTLLLFRLYWRDARRSRGLQAFFASVTHELRTPLTSMRLQAESLADAIPKDSPDRRLVDRLLEDSVRLESQVEKTLELSRIEGGGPVTTRPVRLKPFVDRYLDSWKGSPLGSKAEILSRIEDVTVLADPARLQMVLRNLFENSIRHSGREKVTITLSSEQHGRAVGLRVADDGQGYPGSVRNLGEIFEKGTDSPGSGVGLYLVRALVERMGGHAQFSAANGFETMLWFKHD